MIPFENTLPYETVGKDVYVNECPFCGTSSVMLPLTTAGLASIRDGKKRLIVFPCCREKMTAVDVDRDYLLADRPIRRQ